jgi:cobalamin biosynthetic protein CobC
MKHGGDLSQAAEAFGAGGEGWLDLSTGINPVAYPFTPPGSESWQRLPQSGALAGLFEAARMAYGAPDDAAIVAAPGTQMLIQLLPSLVRAGKVAIVGPT